MQILRLKRSRQKIFRKAHDNIMKVERIIEEFQSTLNHKYPVAKDFDEVYNYLMVRLRDANMKKDKGNHGRSVKTFAHYARYMERSYETGTYAAVRVQRIWRKPIYSGYDTEPEEKSEILDTIMELNIRQGEELENPALDPDDFDKTVEKKVNADRTVGTAG